MVETFLSAHAVNIDRFVSHLIDWQVKRSASEDDVARFAKYVRQEIARAYTELIDKAIAPTWLMVAMRTFDSVVLEPERLAAEAVQAYLRQRAV